MSASQAPTESERSAYERILAEIGSDLTKVDKLLTERLTESEEPLIPELARHLIEAGGKRLRPVLALAAARACNYEGEHHIRLAAAVELIHSATLLHDDVVDGSELRRGRAAANTLWGNKPSVLVGDFLFSRSFQLMVETGSLSVLRSLADAAATIAEGEVMQLSTAHDLTTTQERYVQVIAAKTAALFSAAAESGAGIADPDPSVVLAYRNYGLALGIAFQLADDALDYGGSELAAGKRVGDDFNEGKATLPVLFAHQAGSPDEQEFWHRTIVEDERNDGDLERAQQIVQERDAIATTIALAEQYASQAQAALESLAASPINAALADLAVLAARRSA